MARYGRLMSVLLMSSVLFLPGCGEKPPTAAGNSSWVPDRHLVSFTFTEAFNQYLQLSTKGAVASYETFQLSGIYKDTVVYGLYRFDQYGNETSYMSYVYGTNVPVTEYRNYTYNADGTVASLSQLQIIDNSVNGGQQVSDDRGTTTFEYDSHRNVVRYTVEASGQITHGSVLYRKNDQTLYRIDSTDTCIYNADGLLLELHSPLERFLFNADGLVTENDRYTSGITQTTWETRTFEYDAQGNLTYCSSRQPGTAWSQTNLDCYYTYQFDYRANWTRSDMRRVEWDDVPAGVDTLSDQVITTYRNMSY